jgi:hypothetical protein
VGIVIEYIVPPIGGPSAIHVAPKYVNNTVLDLLSNFDQVHILPASCRAFNLSATEFSMGRYADVVGTDLDIVTIVLVEPLQALDQ